MSYRNPLNVIIDGLRAGRAIIEDRNHWAKGTYRSHAVTSGVTRFCAVGAIREVAAKKRDPQSLDDDMRMALMMNIPQRYGCVEDYNDDDATKHADVLALYDRAIASLAEEAERDRLCSELAKTVTYDPIVVDPQPETAPEPEPACV